MYTLAKHFLILFDLCHTSRLWKTSWNSLAVKNKRKYTFFHYKQPFMEQNLALNTELHCMLQYIYALYSLTKQKMMREKILATKGTNFKDADIHVKTRCTM